MVTMHVSNHVATRTRCAMALTYCGGNVLSTGSSGVRDHTLNSTKSNGTANLFFVYVIDTNDTY